MEDNVRFGEEEEAANFGDELEFEQLDEIDNDVEVELLCARVRAARLAGA